MAVRRETGGADAGPSEPTSVWAGLEVRGTEVSRSPERSVHNSYVAFVHFSSPFLTKRERPPTRLCLGLTVKLTPEEMFAPPLNASKHLSPLPF